MSALLRTTLSAAMVTTAVASCAHGTTFMPRAVGEIPISTFGYAGLTGPTNWFSLNTTTNTACAMGTNQSPIDITADTVGTVSGSELTIDLPDFETGALFENLGSTIEIVGDGGSVVLAGGNKTFNFAQVHFHTPSEHLESGRAIAMEGHFVFQADDAEIAVLGVYIDIADDTEEIDSIAANASSVIETAFASVGSIATPGTAVNTSALAMSSIVSFLQSTTFRTYTGSLTTPPCSEGINWHVASDMLYIPLASYKAARNVIGFNSRFPQGAPGEQNILSALNGAMNGVVPTRRRYSL